MNAPQEHHVTFDRSTSRPARSSNPFSIIVHLCCRILLTLGGWKLEGDWPDEDKVVLVAAPHTSNWDAFNMLIAAGYYRIRLNWMGKKTLTTGPFGWLLRWLGCVPVDRASKHDTVQQMCTIFAERKKMVLAISPEGTRTRTAAWKTGFYHIAHKAGVPIMMTVQDYGSKTIRLSGMLMPSGNYNDDLELIKGHYRNAYGKYHDQFSNAD